MMLVILDLVNDHGDFTSKKETLHPDINENKLPIIYSHTYTARTVQHVLVNPSVNKTS